MVLESIINPIRAEKHPLRMFFVGILYSSIALWLGLWIFADQASLVMVFLTVLACMPLMYSTLKYEEHKDEEMDNEPSLLKEHSKALYFFMMLFFGITVSLAVWYVVLPADSSAQVFSIQQQTISGINGKTTSLDIFSGIFLNNVRVLVFCVLFAFVYGLGAIFILVWNASVISAAMGDFFRMRISEVASSLGYVNAGAYFSAGLFSIVRYAPHGVLEILSYFVAGLAGSIISIAVINHDFGTKTFEKIIFDAANLLTIAFFLLVLAALVETFITPILAL